MFFVDMYLYILFGLWYCYKFSRSIIYYVVLVMSVDFVHILSARLSTQFLICRDDGLFI